MKKFAFLALLLCGTASAQVVPAAPPPPAPVPTPTANPSDDIVVSGLRDLNDPQSRVTYRTLNSDRSGPGANMSSDLFSYSSRLAKCVTKKGSASTRALLRKVLDSRINSTAQAAAQDRLLEMYAACTEVPFVQAVTGTRRTTSFTDDFDGAYYDRGALYIEALHAFAPDLRLTKSDTARPDVIARFNAREDDLAKFRLPTDRRYFAIAVCTVRTHPELAVKLVKTDGPRDAIERLEAAIVNASPACFGNARKVYFDPTQFRFYIADALYRWAVAVQGVNTLIPD